LRERQDRGSTKLSTFFYGHLAPAAISNPSSFVKARDAVRRNPNGPTKLSECRLVLCRHQRPERCARRVQSLAQSRVHRRGPLLIMAFFGGIGGGVVRDLLLNDLPSPLKNPAYLGVCLLMGLLGLAIYRYLESKEEQFRTRTLAFFKSFTLPSFAILGTRKALDHGLGIFGAIVVGLISTVAGGVLIDLFSGVTSEVVRPWEQGVTTAVLASTVYSVTAVLTNGTFNSFLITLIAVLVAFIFRVVAAREHFLSIVPFVPPAASSGTQV
jgi:uncharacterized membrane protein YeiH